RRIKTGYTDVKTASLNEAIWMATEAKRKGEALAIGLVGNVSDILPEMIKRSFIPDILTDQTSAHDPLNGYIPSKMTLDETKSLRQSDPEEYIKRAKASMAKHVQAMLDMMEKGSVTFDYGNNIRQMAK